MKFIGLTGSIATGKSTVAKMFKDFGCYIIDADELAHEVYSKGKEGYKKVIDAFGKTILDKNENIDRKKLAAKVLKNRKQLKKLESIVHPLLEKKRNKILEEIKQKDPKAIVIYDVPLLFEKNMQNIFDCTIVVWVDRETQLQRLMRRNGLSEQEAKERIKLQIPIDRKKELADIVIDNSKDLKHTKNQVKEIVKRLKTGKLC